MPVFPLCPPFGVRRITVSPQEKILDESICLPQALLALWMLMLWKQLLRGLIHLAAIFLVYKVIFSCSYTFNDRRVDFFNLFLFKNCPLNQENAIWPTCKCDQSQLALLLLEVSYQEIIQIMSQQSLQKAEWVSLPMTSGPVMWLKIEALIYGQVCSVEQSEQDDKVEEESWL